MNKQREQKFFFAAAALVLLITTGCQTTYMQNRKKDLLQTFDIGICYNTKWRPNFEFYFDTLSTVACFGFGYVDDAKMIGMANGKIGVFDKNAHELGLMAYGWEHRGIGEFDPNNRFHAGDRYKDATDWPYLTHGWIGATWGTNPIPKAQYGQCSRGMHLGWVGIEISNRITEVVDFLLGWFTVDIMHDDLQ
ncbi:MAG: hypothetical protein N3D11_00875 [Candidatus Sumerlaeia bacterium]|nr:hypothetical protein [Candidatus Sumerlaeia bacterium]